MGDVRTCPDCAVPPGTAHEDGCDVARCLATGGQRLSCGGPVDEDGILNYDAYDLGDGTYGYAPHDCGTDVWTGLWPGDAECREFGWWALDRCAQGRGWVRCPPGTPGAVEDLNRLHVDARWSRELCRWVLRQPAQTAVERSGGLGHGSGGPRPPAASLAGRVPLPVDAPPPPRTLGNGQT